MVFKRLFPVALFSLSILVAGCEGCVQKVAKKTTDLGLSAIEGVSEAIAEHGEETGEKITDALGALAKGAGRSIERQLDEHAEHVASVAGRTFVQAMDGLESGTFTEYYDMLPHEDNFGSGIVLQYYGKIKEKDVIDAYFIIIEGRDYECKFDFVDNSGKTVLTRNASIKRINTEKKISVVSLALNNEELALFNQSVKTKIKVAPKAD